MKAGMMVWNGRSYRLVRLLDTSHPDHIDPRVLRGSRLSEKIEIGLPGRDGAGASGEMPGRQRSCPHRHSCRAAARLCTSGSRSDLDHRPAVCLRPDPNAVWEQPTEDSNQAGGWQGIAEYAPAKPRPAACIQQLWPPAGHSRLRASIPDRVRKQSAPADCGAFA